jgi:hypothetical protein
MVELFGRKRGTDSLWMRGSKGGESSGDDLSTLDWVDVVLAVAGVMLWLGMLEARPEPLPTRHPNSPSQYSTHRPPTHTPMHPFISSFVACVHTPFRDRRHAHHLEGTKTAVE